MTFQDFVIALGKAFGITLIVGGIAFVLLRAFWIRWSKRWQFKIKYDVFKHPVDPVKAEWCMDAVKRDLTPEIVKMKLYLSGFKNEDVHEILYIFNKFYKSLKGGKNGREHKRYNQENERGKYPNISKEIQNS